MEEERTNKWKFGSFFGGDDTDKLCFTQDRGHRLGGTIHGVAGSRDEMDAPPANKGSADKELDFMRGET